MLNEDDMRRKPYVERKAALRKLLRGRGIQYVEHAEEPAKSFLRLSANLGLRASFQKIRPIDRGRLEGLDQGQKPEGPCCYAVYRWYFLDREFGITRIVNMASANISGIARDFFLDFLEHYLFTGPVWNKYEWSKAR